MLTELRRGAGQLKAEVFSLYWALRDPRTPWYAKAIGVLVVAYAFSPLDLIPDFIPVLGYLDDALLLPLGLWLTLRLIPPAVLAESRAKAQTELHSPPTNWAAAALIVVIWVGAIGLTALMALRLFRP